MTSSGLHPNRSAASAAYCWTTPSMLHVITDVSVVNAFPSFPAVSTPPTGGLRNRGFIRRVVYLSTGWTREAPRRCRSDPAPRGRWDLDRIVLPQQRVRRRPPVVRRASACRSEERRVGKECRSRWSG